MMITILILLLTEALEVRTNYAITTSAGSMSEISVVTGSSVSEISMMTGSSVSLPCNMTSSIPGDKVRLVLWYRDDIMAPIYSLDSRGMWTYCDNSGQFCKSKYLLLKHDDNLETDKLSVCHSNAGVTTFLS